MRTIAIVGLTVIATARLAAAESMWDADVHLGYSVSPSKFAIAGTGSYAFEYDPPLSAYGGLVVDVEPKASKSAIGALFGVRLESGPLRLAAGGTWMFAPKTMWGAQGSLGACKRVATHLKVCADVELTEYVAGTAVMDGTAVTQILFGTSVVIDGG